MHEFVEAFRFIAHDGAVAGQPALPSLGYLTLQTLKVGVIGLAISLVVAIPVGVWLGHLHRESEGMDLVHRSDFQLRDRELVKFADDLVPVSCLDVHRHDAWAVLQFADLAPEQRGRQMLGHLR